MMKIKKIYYLFNRWFDIKLGWFFVNGRKIDSYNEKLKEKYSEGIDI
jgi:hypothetical protein